MKIIELKANDKDILKLICEQSPDGITIEQVRRAIRVIDRIEAAIGELALEDADHQFLVSKFAQMKFVKADREILDLYDRLASAQEPAK